MSYLVVELQTYSDGSMGHIEWPFDNQAEAESRFHAVLSAAAVSEVTIHSCSLLASDGRLLNRGCYEHYPEVVEQPESQPEVEE